MYIFKLILAADAASCCLKSLLVEVNFPASVKHSPGSLSQITDYVRVCSKHEWMWPALLADLGGGMHAG